jgi:hypothetical protein
MCDSNSEGMNTLRNSEEKTPPFFIALVFLMLSVSECRGWRKWNSLQATTHYSYHIVTSTSSSSLPFTLQRKTKVVHNSIIHHVKMFSLSSIMQTH